MFLGVTQQEWIALGIKVTVATIMTVIVSNYMVELVSPTDKKTKENAKKLLKSVGIKKDIELDQHELEIATQIVDPKNIKVTWDDIGGLEDIIENLKTDIIYLIKKPQLMKSSNFFRPPKGILFYGPPGCGKTMLAQAVAKESGARFINLNISSLTNKWYGESIKLAGAVFSLAKKISPCIIFIDEIDTFLRSRSMNDHEATVMMKAQFLQLWDGFAVNSSNIVMIIGATNRKFDIDQAILSRMDIQFEIKLPSNEQRKLIYSRMLKDMKTDRIDVNFISKLSESFSGRDINDVCREASMISVREYFKENNLNKTKKDEKELQNEIRKIKLQDFLNAINLKKQNISC